MHAPCPPTARARTTSRRASATVSILIVLVGLQLAVALSVLGGARDQDLGSRRVDTIRAFYAAEAGVNMAVRELMQDVDEDSDGGIGSISSDGNDANDPLLGRARLRVQRADAGGTTTLTSRGTCGTARRDIEAFITE